MSTIKPKTGKCVDCAPDYKDQPLIAGRCSSHYWVHRADLARKGKLKINTKHKPIPKVSAKQMKRLAEYRKVRDEFMKLHPTCQAKLSGCTIKASDLHHSKGRTGDLLTDKRYFKALCRKCHGYVETHPEQAKELGLSDSRLNTII